MESRAKRQKTVVAKYFESDDDDDMDEEAADSEKDFEDGDGEEEVGDDGEAEEEEDIGEDGDPEIAEVAEDAVDVTGWTDEQKLELATDRAKEFVRIFRDDPMKGGKQQATWVEKLEIGDSFTTIEMESFFDDKWGVKVYKYTRRKAIQVFQPIDPHFGKIKTFAMTAELYNTRGYADTPAFKGFYPLPEDHPQQKWNDEDLTPSQRSLTVSDGTTPKQSPSYTDMQQKSISGARRIVNKLLGARRKSEAKMGHAQLNAVEGVAIELLYIFWENNILGFRNRFRKLPVFDGLQADFILLDLSTGYMYAIQMKGANIKLGKTSIYGLKKGQYDPRIYCIGIGILDYVRDINPKDPNDNSPGTAQIFEIWDIGDSNNIKASLGPSPGIPYSRLDKSRRLYVKHARPGIDNPGLFAQKMIDKILLFPHLSLNTIYFDIPFNKYDIEKKEHRNNITEMLQNKAQYTIFKSYSIVYKPPWRQGETTDVCIAHNGVQKYISNKVASENHKNDAQRQIDLHTAPNHRLCDYVIAAYIKDLITPTKFAVIDSIVAYAKIGGKAKRPTFCWNEKEKKPRSMKHVKIYDTSTPAGELAFVRHFFPDAQKNA